MTEQKEDIEKREWLVNIIIGIRKEVLVKLRALMDSFDREKYTFAQRSAISQEIREIAELVSEKDSFMKRREQIQGIPFENKVKKGSLIDITRTEARNLLNEIRNGILAIEYDGEYAIIDKELSEIELLVGDKDRLIYSRVQSYYAGGKVNPHIAKYFKMDDAPDNR